MAGELVTNNGQIEWRGVLLGAGTAYRLRRIEGWLDLPETRDGDVELANEHGSQMGQLLLGRRTITFEFTLSGSPSQFADWQRTLRKITALDDNPVEEPLVIQWDGIKAMVNARVIRRSIPSQPNNAVGYSQGAIQWRATNPRLLHLPQVVRSTTAPTAGAGGLVWPLVWPLVWGSAQAGGEIVAVNHGNAAVQPVWRITGPCLGPSIRNADTGQQLLFDSGWQLPSGQRVTLTHETRTVLLDTGVSRSPQLATRGWFTLPPGDTRIRFDSLDGQGELELIYYSTSL